MAGKRTQAVESRVLQFIRQHNLAATSQTIVVAVSGGADSVCLLHLLSQNRAELGINLHVAHLDHQLRGKESEADASYVAGLAARLGINVTIGRKNVAAYRRRQHCSLEEAAREVRYAFLSDVARSVKAASIAVGHTADDRVETILLHLLRGSGISGLRGLLPLSQIKAGRGKSPCTIIRPLLEVTREETQAYCRRLNLKARTDSSNQSTIFLRNSIRLELLPVLREYNPNIDSALLRLADIAVTDTAFIEQQASVIYRIAAEKQGKNIYLDRRILSAAPQALQRQLCRMAVEQAVGNLKDIELEHIEEIIAFLQKPAGKELCLPSGLKLTNEYSRLILSASTPDASPPLAQEHKITVPGVTLLPGWLITTEVVKEPAPPDKNAFTACFDFSKTGADLTVRCRKPGDRFQPLGMGGSRKLQDFMVDEKISRPQRSNVPLLCSSADILWVVGCRIDEKAKVTENTGEILKVTFKRRA